MIDSRDAVAGPFDARAARPRLAGALAAITAAVVGVILNLSVWFALHVLFGTINTAEGLALPLPDLASLDPWAVVLTGLAMVLMLWLRVGLLPALFGLALCGALLGQFGVV